MREKTLEDILWSLFFINWLYELKKRKFNDHVEGFYFSSLWKPDACNLPELVEWSFKWPQLWLSLSPLFCYISLIYSGQDRVRDRVPDCLYFPQRLIVVRQYIAR